MKDAILCMCSHCSGLNGFYAPENMAAAIGIIIICDWCGFEFNFKE